MLVTAYESHSLFDYLASRAQSYSIVLATGATLASALSTAVVKAWNERVGKKRMETLEHIELEKMSASWSDAKTQEILEIAGRDETAAPKITKRWRTHDSAFAPRAKTPTEVARERVVLRIAEAVSIRTEQLSSAKRSALVANGLTWTNYILGGVLASSFVQETVSPKWAGGLGVLVLIASLIKQQYHPDSDSEISSNKALQLLALIRSSEDQLAILDAKNAAGEDVSNEMMGQMKWLTQRLGEIEMLRATQQELNNGRTA